MYTKHTWYPCYPRPTVTKTESSSVEQRRKDRSPLWNGTVLVFFGIEWWQQQRILGKARICDKTLHLSKMLNEQFSKLWTICKKIRSNQNKIWKRPRALANQSEGLWPPLKYRASYKSSYQRCNLENFGHCTDVHIGRIFIPTWQQKCDMTPTSLPIKMCHHPKHVLTGNTLEVLCEYSCTLFWTLMKKKKIVSHVCNRQCTNAHIT